MGVANPQHHLGGIVALVRVPRKDKVRMGTMTSHASLHRSKYASDWFRQERKCVGSGDQKDHNVVLLPCQLHTGINRKSIGISACLCLLVLIFFISHVCFVLG